MSTRVSHTRESVLALVERTGLGDCWLWTGSRTRKGYGRVQWDGRTVQAHRLVYELLVGPIPVGLYLDHLCRNPRCVRPDHCEPVSNGENVLRGFGPPAVNARKTHCLRGHPLPDRPG